VQVEALVGRVRENPLLSLDDLVWSFREQAGVTVSAESKEPVRSAPRQTIKEP
jgi:hypothetical protein